VVVAGWRVVAKSRRDARRQTMAVDAMKVVGETVAAARGAIALARVIGRVIAAAMVA
jgi:hypothetical protein